MLSEKTATYSNSVLRVKLRGSDIAIKQTSLQNELLPRYLWRVFEQLHILELELN